jgi:protein OS-9
MNAIDSKPLAQTLFPRKDCYYYTNQNEWWGYEVCPRQEIVQFHLSAKTAGQEQISSLGKYSMDFDWEQAELAETLENSESDNSDLLKNFKKYSSLKTHVQYYSEGKICDITKKPRTTELHWKCHGSGGTRLVRIEEPSTCNYVIHMHSALMCGHEKFESDVSSFKESDKKLPILETVCYKAVGDGEFGNYQAAIAMEAQNRLEARMQRDEILAKFELDADNAMGKSVDNVLSDISTEHLQTESGTGEVLNYQEIKTGLTDIFSKLVKKELEKLDDDASQSDELNSPESKIKTNLDKPIGEKFIDQADDENNVPDQLRELKKEVVANLKQAGQLQDGEEMQEIKIKIMNVDENGNLVEGDLESVGAAPKFTSQQLKQIKQALMGAIVKETPEHGKKAQNNHLLDSEIYNDKPEDLGDMVENAGYYLDDKSVENDENSHENNYEKYDGSDDTTEFMYHEEL